MGPEHCKHTIFNSSPTHLPRTGLEPGIKSRNESGTFSALWDEGKTYTSVIQSIVCYVLGERNKQKATDMRGKAFQRIHEVG